MITWIKNEELICDTCRKNIIQIPMIIGLHRLGYPYSKIYCESCWSLKGEISKSILCAYTTKELKALLKAVEELADIFAPLVKGTEEALNSIMKIIVDFVEKLAKVIICPKCGSDMSKQSKRGSDTEPCAECYLGGLLAEDADSYGKDERGYDV